MVNGIFKDHKNIYKFTTKLYTVIVQYKCMGSFLENPIEAKKLKYVVSTYAKMYYKISKLYSKHTKTKIYTYLLQSHIFIYLQSVI